MANLAVFPLYYYYVCLVADEHPRFRILSILPALLGGVTVGILYLSMSEKETNDFFNNYLYQTDWSQLYGVTKVQGIVHQAIRILFLLILIPTVYHSWQKIKTYNHYVRDYYADIDDKEFTIPNSLVVLFFVTVFVSIICSIIGRNYFNYFITLLAIPSVLFSCLLFLIAYKGFTQNFSGADFRKEINKLKERSSMSVSTETQDDVSDKCGPQKEEPTTDTGNNITNFSELGKRIKQLLYEEKIYLTHNLTINELATMLGTNREYIYKAFKEEIGLSFSEAVNRLRIEHAIQLLMKQPDKSMFLLADEAGFASATSFYRNFKLYKGCSPKQWQQRINTRKTGPGTAGES